MICGIVGEGLGDRGLCTAATRPSSTFPCFLLRWNFKVVVSPPAKPQLSSTTNLPPLIALILIICECALVNLVSTFQTRLFGVFHFHPIPVSRVLFRDRILLAASVRMTPPPLQTKPTCTTRAALSFRYQFGFSVHFCQKQILHIIHLSPSSPTNRRNKTWSISMEALSIVCIEILLTI